MRFVFATPRKLKSTFVALRRGFDELYPVPQELPDFNWSGTRAVRIF